MKAMARISEPTLKIRWCFIESAAQDTQLCYRCDWRDNDSQWTEMAWQQVHLPNTASILLSVDTKYQASLDRCLSPLSESNTNGLVPCLDWMATWSTVPLLESRWESLLALVRRLSSVKILFSLQVLDSLFQCTCARVYMKNRPHRHKLAQPWGMSLLKASLSSHAGIQSHRQRCCSVFMLALPRRGH